MNLDRKGLLGTILVHVVVLILFMVLGFKTQLPLPGEAGILINFGDVEEAFGKEEPRYNEQPHPQTRREAVPKPVEQVKSQETNMTQDFEEAPAIAEKKKPEKKPEKKPVKPVEKPREEPIKEVPVEEVQSYNFV